MGRTYLAREVRSCGSREPRFAVFQHGASLERWVEASSDIRCDLLSIFQDIAGTRANKGQLMKDPAMYIRERGQPDIIGRLKRCIPFEEVSNLSLQLPMIKIILACESFYPTLSQTMHCASKNLWSLTTSISLSRNSSNKSLVQNKAKSTSLLGTTIPPLM